jgi:hypothetical protein
VYWFDPGDPGNPLRTLMAAADAASGTLQNNLLSLFGGRTPHPDGVGCQIVTDGPLVYSLADRFGGPQLQDDPAYAPYYDPNCAWDPLAADDRPNLVVFGAARRNPWPDLSSAADDEFVAEDIFPGALRITMDVYDGERRLDRPVRHVMVVPVGGE